MKITKLVTATFFSSALLITSINLFADEHKNDHKEHKDHKNEEIKLEGKLHKKDAFFMLRTTKNQDVKIPEDNKKIKLEEFLDKNVSIEAKGTITKGANGEDKYTLTNLLQIKLNETDHNKKEEKK